MPKNPKPKPIRVNATRLFKAKPNPMPINNPAGINKPEISSFLFFSFLAIISIVVSNLKVF